MYFRKPRGSLFGNAVMSQEEIDRFLGERHCATLGYQNVNGFPGVAPVNYAWDGKAFYLHCARKGERYESLLRNQKVALNVYHDANNEADENGMAEHLSVTAYGRVRDLRGEEALRALDLIAHQAGKAFKARGEGNAPFLRQLDVYAVEPEYMTGRKIRWRSQPAHE